MSTVCQQKSRGRARLATVVALDGARTRRLALVIADELRSGHGSTIHSVDKVDNVDLWRRAARQAGRVLGVPIRTGLAPDGSRVWAVDSLLRLVANNAGVSLSAAAVRIAEVSGRTCMLLRWQRAPSRWVVIGQAAAPPQFAGSIQATPETSEQLDSLPSRRDVWSELSLLAGSGRLIGDAHIDRSGKTCMTLFTTLRAPAGP